MATKDQPNYALLEFGGTSMVLPANVAAQAFTLLCQGELVEYDWGNKAHKRVTDPHRMPTLKVFTLSQYAALALEEPAE